MATDKGATAGPPPKESRVRPQTAGRATPARPSGPPVVKRIQKYYGEVMTELRKAIWPSRTELRAQTQVVLGVLVAIGVSVALFDTVLGVAVNLLLRLVGAGR